MKVSSDPRLIHTPCLFADVEERQKKKNNNQEIKTQVKDCDVLRIVRRSKLWMHENWVDFASVGLFLSAKAKKKKNPTTIDTAKNRQAHKYSASLGHKHKNKG